MSGSAGAIALVRHPAGPAPSGIRLGADAGRSVAGDLEVRFAVGGAVDAIAVPPAGPRSFVNGLWRHTCFEVFVGVGDDPSYHEWNLSPSGEWAAHAFRRYRDGGPLEDESLAPGITVRSSSRHLELAATIPLHRLSARHGQGALRIGLAAVIEDREGALSWWALRHPPGPPDFHHADAFALRLEPPGA